MQYVDLVGSMSDDEWRPIMQAGSVEEKITAFADLAQKRAEERDDDVEGVVRSMTHESYLLKHTTTDVLSELQDLAEAYPDEFYNGDANEHIAKRLNEMGDMDFWSDYPAAALAAGLEWAILSDLQTRQEPV